MLHKLKKNFPLIIVILILTFLGIKSVYTYIKENKTWEKQEQQIYENCKNGTIQADSICSKYNTPVKKRDIISTYGYITQNYDITNLQIFAPLLIIFVAISLFHKLVRKGYLKNSITRIEYSKALKGIYYKTLKYSFIIPIFLIIIFIISSILSDNFDYIYSVSHYMYDSFGINNVKNIVIFLILYFANFILHGIFWINIGVYNSKHTKNYIACVIVSYIEYMLLLILFQIIGLNFFSGTSIVGYLSLPIIWTYSEGVSIYIVTIISLFISLFSSLIVYLSYRNKEKVLEEISK